MMSRIEENNRWRCMNCRKELKGSEFLTAPSPFDPTDLLTACPHCKQCDEHFELICDEPGCTQQASCGWPTGDDSDEWGGYRNTCGKHYVPKPSDR